MKVLIFGFYDSNPRGNILIKGLKLNGVDLIDCRVNKGRGATWRLLLKYIFQRKKFNVMIVPFPGRALMLWARLMTTKPIVFDIFLSDYESYVLDRAYYRPGSFRAYWYWLSDFISCRLADMVLLDTDAHIEFFVRQFHLKRNKFRRIFIGADTDIFKPSKLKNQTPFRVHFHGTYIPLQGTEYIIRAAKILEGNGWGKEIIFTMIGGGQTFGRDQKFAENLELTNVNFIPYVASDKLPDYLASADLCLGIFGTTPKTNLVIPNKIFEGLASSRPVLTCRSRAIRELFADNKNIILCHPGNPQDLADKILLLKNDSFLRQNITREGFKIFSENLTEDKLGLELTLWLKTLC